MGSGCLKASVKKLIFRHSWASQDFIFRILFLIALSITFIFGSSYGICGVCQYPRMINFRYYTLNHFLNRNYAIFIVYVNSKLPQLRTTCKTFLLKRNYLISAVDCIYKNCKLGKQLLTGSSVSYCLSTCNISITEIQMLNPWYHVAEIKHHEHMYVCKIICIFSCRLDN